MPCFDVATRSYFGLDLEVREEVRATVADGGKIFCTIFIRAGFGLLLVAVAVALSGSARGRSL